MSSTVYQETIEHILFSLKNRTNIAIPFEFSVALSRKIDISIYVIDISLIKKKRTILLLAKWRKKANIWFPAQFPVTVEGTKKWATEQLHKKKDRILFFIKLIGSSNPFGHVGLYRFNFKEKSCEIDNIIRGENIKGTEGAMTVGLQALIGWVFGYLQIKTLYLQVFSDNKKAIALYERLGFKEISRVPLVSKVENNIVTWVEKQKPLDNTQVKRYFIRMILTR